jgi:hypothetical protein
LRQIWFSDGQGHVLEYSAQLAALVPIGATVYIGTALALWMMSGRPVGGESRFLSIGKLAVDKLMKLRKK